MALIEVRNVSKTYRKGTMDVVALDSVSLAIEKGESVALMGPSGSGKTTLMNLMAGIDRPTRGDVVIGGENIATKGNRWLSRWRTRNIGYIFQLYHLIPVLTAYENVELPLTLLRMNARERKNRVTLALRAVNMEDRMDHFPRQLSGGQEQRVAIARAIVGDPAVLIADEPTGDLDRRSAAEIMELLKKLNRDFGKTMVIVTHDQGVADQAGRTVHLDKGYIVEGTKSSADPA